MTFTLIGVGLLILMTVVMIVMIMTRYKRCASNQVLVKFGKVGGDKSSVQIHGGATFVWPVIQDFEYMSLEPIGTEIDLKGALSKQNIRVNVPSSFTFAIGTTEELMAAAAERLLGMSRDKIETAAQEIIFGQLRATIATMDIEEINGDREKFEKQVMENIETELKKIGLCLINVNISDITDESGYLEALGKEAASKAVNEALVKVAENDRTGATGEANANAERRKSVAEAETAGEKGYSEAEAAKRTAVADAKAIAVTAENTAAVVEANSKSERDVAEATANKIADAAKAVASAEALAEGYSAEQAAEEKRAERDKAAQYANVVVPAEIAKQKAIINAEADKQAEVLAGEAKGEARQAELAGEAKGLEAIVAAAGGNAKDAAMLMIVQQLPAIVDAQARAISNIDFDKIVVIGGGDNGAGGAADFMRSMANSLPGLHELAEAAGLKLPDFMGAQDEPKLPAPIEAPAPAEEKAEEKQVAEAE